MYIIAEPTNIHSFAEVVGFYTHVFYGLFFFHLSLLRFHEIPGKYYLLTSKYRSIRESIQVSLLKRLHHEIKERR